MTAYTLAANTNIDALSPARTGGDTVATAGFTFVVDQDTRYGLGGGAGFSLGALTITATSGGVIRFDARKVRLIAYTGGSGNVPAYNTAITQGSATGKLISVMSSLTAAPTAPGAAMPASGYIKIKQWNDVEYTAAALGGITATASGASVVGWIEIVGDEAATINANRLGTVEFLGEWYELGTTSGTSNQTLQIPTNGSARYAAGVFIEATAGAGDYEFWPNAGTATSTGTEAARGKVCWIDATGLVRLGNSGAATNGHTPTSGRKVVIGNIFLENCTTAARTVNVIPNATIATRYDFTTTGGGVVTMDKVNSGWYLSFSQAYSVTLTNLGAIDGILASEIATAMTWSKVGVGNKPTTVLTMSPLTMSLCFAGGTFTDCVWQRANMASSGNHTLTLTDISGFTFLRNTLRCGVTRANATTYSVNATRMNNCAWTDCIIVQGAISLTTCNGVTVTNVAYTDVVSGTTGTTYAMYVWVCASNTLNCTFTGLSFPVTNTHPYTALLAVNAAGCDNIKLRNIGTRTSPLTMGSANACGLIYAFGSGAAATNIKIQRVYCSNTRTGVMTGDNSTKGVTEEHVFGDYADAADVAAVLNYSCKARGTSLALTAQTAVYGTHWRDHFTSTTAGRIVLLMNEPTADTASQVSLTGGAAFTSAGGLYMPVIGHSAIFETPDFILGHTGFQNSAAVMGGGTATNYTYEYSIDKNDGNGWSAMTSSSYTATTLATALNGLTGIDASLGFKLRIKITTGTTNSTAITSLYLLTNSTTTAQDYTYPLDTLTLTLTGIQTGSDIVILNAGTTTERVNVDANPTTSYAYTYETTGNVDICVYKQGYVPFTIRNYPLASSNATLPIAQVADRNFAA